MTFKRRLRGHGKPYKLKKETPFIKTARFINTSHSDSCIHFSSLCRILRKNTPTHLRPTYFSLLPLPFISLPFTFFFLWLWGWFCRNNRKYIDNIIFAYLTMQLIIFQYCFLPFRASNPILYYREIHLIEREYYIING